MKMGGYGNLCGSPQERAHGIVGVIILIGAFGM